MAVSESRTVAGVRREWWDDDTETHHRVEADGVTAESGWPQPYTPLDLEAKAARVARVTVTTNDAAQRDKLRTGIPRLRTAIAEVEAIAAGASGNTRVLAEDLVLSLRANLALAKLLAGVLDTED